MFNLLLVIFFVGTVNGLTKFTDLFPNIPNIVENGNGELCKKESKIYQENLKNRTLWAYEMFDSSAKSIVGVLQGNSMELGNYQECLDVAGPFPTQHCIITVNINIPVANTTQNFNEDPYTSAFVKFQKPHIGRSKAMVGLCFPASCSTRDIDNSLTEYFQRTETPFQNEGVTYNITLTEDHMCTNKLHPNEFGALQIIFCLLLVYLVVLVLVATVIDHRTKDEKEDFRECSKVKQILFSFSARRTWKILFGCKKNNSFLGIFHGVRSISQLFIIIGHLGYVPYIILWVEMDSIEKFRKYQQMNIFAQLTLVLDIFFLMSGLLLSYGSLQKMKTFKINPVMLIVYRYVRLTPLNAFITFYLASMLSFSGSGPAWNLVTQSTTVNCLNNWWTNIFYVNNLVVGFDDWCNKVTWYLSADFQLFIMGAVVMYIIRRNQRAGYGVLIFLLLLSFVPPLILTALHNFEMITSKNTNPENFSNIYYLKPYNYATTYIIGLIGGVIFDKFSFQKVKISKSHSRWIFGISILLMAISFGYPIIADNDQENYRYEHAMYNSVYKPLWAVGLLGALTVASFGSNSNLGSFLSARIWIPFSKLSYGLYLTHWSVLIVNFASSTDLMRPTTFNLISLFASVTTISFAAAFVLYFLVEMPFIKVFSILLVPKDYNKIETINQQIQTTRRKKHWSTEG